MNTKPWGVAAVAAGVVAAATTLVVVSWAQSRYQKEFALRMARTTASYVSAVTPPPPPPPPPPRVRRRARRAPISPPPPPPPAPFSAGARSYHLPALMTQARALKSLPGWTSDVEVYYGTAPLVDATAAPLTPDDLHELDSAASRWRNGVALVPLRDREGREIVGAVALRPLPMPTGPVPGGIGFVFPAALFAVGVAAAIAFRGQPLRRGGYVGAALLLAAAAFVDVRTAARNSTDRWLLDTRRLVVEAAARIPPPGVRVNVSDLAALVRNGEGELLLGEPAESAPRRVQIDGERRRGVAQPVGPAEAKGPRLIDQLPNERDRHDRADIRRQERRTEQSSAPALAMGMHQERGEQREDHRDRYVQRVDQRVSQRELCKRIVHDCSEIRE